MIRGIVSFWRVVKFCLGLLFVGPSGAWADWTVMDNDSAGFTSANLTFYSGASPYGAFNDTQRHSVPTGTTNTWAAWTFTDLANGLYDVAVCHPRYAGHVGNWNGMNRFLVTDGLDGYGWFTSVRFPYYTNDIVIVDSMAVPRAFTQIGTGPIRVTNGTLQVRLLWHTNTASVVADAVAIRPTTNRTVFISDDLSGSVIINMPGFGINLPGSVAGSKYFSSTSTATSNEFVRWTFAGATPGKYRIWTTWTPASNLSTNAVHSIYSSGDLLAAQSINQESPPINHAEDWGAVWQQLTNGADEANLYSITGTVFFIQLQGVPNAAGSDYVAADAIRVEWVEPIYLKRGTVLIIR